MLKKHSLILAVLFAGISSSALTQVRGENLLLKWGSWALLQAIPSPVLFEDRNDLNSTVTFGLEWQVIPFSYTFNENKYVSKLNFFYIKPVKRFSGSAEVFFEPSLITGTYKYSDLGKFSYKSGCRLVLPIAQGGEYFAISMGAGYYLQNTKAGEPVEGVTYEAGLYSFFGMLGLKFNYNYKAHSRYNIGLYFKYY